jgi:hypothetical protein
MRNLFLIFFLSLYGFLPAQDKATNESISPFLNPYDGKIISAVSGSGQEIILIVVNGQFTINNKTITTSGRQLLAIRHHIGDTTVINMLLSAIMQ